MTDLSPAAQAVLNAYRSRWDFDLATALRALADQVAPETPLSEPEDPEMLKGIWDERRTIRNEILAIAAELEGDDEPTFTPEEIEMIAAPWSYLQSQQELDNNG